MLASTGLERIPASAAMPGYARFIGRVGALAVALGVGAAVATGYGVPVAHADDTTQSSNDNKGDGDSGQDNDNTNDNDNDNDNDNEDQGDDDGDDNETVGDKETLGDDEEGDDSQTTLSEDDLKTDDGIGNDEQQEQGGGNLLLQGDPIGGTPAPAEIPVTPPPPVDVTPPAPLADPPPTVPVPEVPKAPVDVIQPAVGDPIADADQHVPVPGGGAPLIADTGPSGADQLLEGATPVEFSVEELDGGANRLTTFNVEDSQGFSAALIAPEPNIIEPEQPDLWAGLATIPGVAARLAYTVAAAFLSPFVVGGPTAPVQPPVLWAVLAWVRREFQRTLFNETPTAMNDPAVTTSEDVAVTISALTNDFDTDEDPLTVTDYTQPEHGTVTYNAATKQFTYTPDENFHGTDTFQYAVSDDAGLPHWHGILGGLFNVGHQDTATVTVTVTSVNDVPVAGGGTLATNEDTPLSTTLSGSDADGDALTYAIVTPPTHGTITNFNSSTGAYTYNPNQDLDTGESRVDTFTYTVSDATSTSQQATVSITVTGANDLPVAVDDDFETDENTTLTFTLDDLLENDVDVDVEPLTPYYNAVLTPPTHGSLTVSGNTFTYVPNAQSLDDGEEVVDTFTYLVHDGTGASNIATVSITVTGVNDAPVAVDDVATTDENTPVGGNVLTNDTDVDDDPLSVANPGNQTGTYGHITINADGSYTYTPGQGGQVVGPNGGTVVLTDSDQVTQGRYDSSFYVDGNKPYAAFTFVPSTTGTYVFEQATIPSGSDTTLFVYSGTFDPASENTNLIAQDDDSGPGLTPRVTANLVAGQTYTIVNSTFGSGGNLGAPLIFSSNGPGVFGGVPIDPDTLDDDETATDTFTYTVTDGDANDTGTVTVTINGVNDAPVAVDDNAGSVAEDSTTPLTYNVVANDTDIDDEPLTVQSATDGQYGTVTFTGGTVTYTPSATNATVQALGAGDPLTDSFTYVVTDGDATDTATVTVTIIGANDAPVATNLDVDTVVQGGSTVTSTVANNVSDPDGDALTATLVTGPTHGTVEFFDDGHFIYHAPTGYDGSASFTYKVNDGTADSNIATVTITNIVNPNLAPDAVNDTAVVAAGQTTNVNVLVNDTDPDATDVVSVVSASNGAHGTTSVNADGTIAYTPAAGYLGSDSFTYTVSDGRGGTDTATVNLEVSAVFDEPVVVELNWGTAPRDLDSHLTGPSAAEDGSRFHVYYSAKTTDGNADGVVDANLAFDDTDGVGPEITTISTLTPGEYHFYVHNFTGSPAIGTSQATVTVHTEAGDQTFTINPAATERYWSVFKLTISPAGAVTITPINTYSNTPPVLPATNM
ncbi:Ig-like domain-containing protein [Mycobacterium sp. NPDC050041]|uniref:YfaP family protein n=1 Tax=Mycobacterium sp. NPDC050041 TaxID=3364293 RepID=UPI003C2D5FB9